MSTSQIVKRVMERSSSIGSCRDQWEMLSCQEIKTGNFYFGYRCAGEINRYSISPRWSSSEMSLAHPSQSLSHGQVFWPYGQELLVESEMVIANGLLRLTNNIDTVIELMILPMCLMDPL